MYLLLLYMVIKGGYKIYNNYRLEKDGFCMEAVTYMEEQRLSDKRFVVSLSNTGLAELNKQKIRISTGVKRRKQ